MTPERLLAPEMEQRLQILRKVLSEQLTDQIRQCTVDPSQWRGAHETNTWFNANRYKYPAAVASAFEEVLKWFETASNEFLAWMRAAIEARNHGDTQAGSELGTRIEELLRTYDQKARSLANGVSRGGNSP